MKKDKISSLQLSLIYAGCILGAGFVSGQEILRYFVISGKYWLIFLVLALSVMFFTSYITLVSVQKLKPKSFSNLISCNNDSKFISILSAILIFGIFTIMTSGAGTIIEEILPVKKIVGTAIFVSIILLFALYGVSSVVNSFTLSVPVLFIATIIISSVAIYKYGNQSYFLDFNRDIEISKLVSAILYSFYNIYASIGTFFEIGGKLNNRKTVITGLIIGSFLILLLAIFISLSIIQIPLSISEELPMLYIANVISDKVGIIYSMLIFTGMLGTGLACCVSSSKILSDTLNISKGKTTVCLCVFAYIISFAKFSSLIKILYPLFGIIGLYVVYRIYQNMRKL